LLGGGARYNRWAVVSEDPDSRSPARIGSVLDGKWTLERLLGSGGMAAVYAARHRNGARGAVKILHRELSRRSDVRERFLREGYVANRVDHPGAVKVLDDDVVADGPDAGTAYLVMELLEGESLQDRLEREPPLGEVEFLRMAQCVLEVLEAAHSRGVVHRDLKPENIFLARAETGASAGTVQVKVLDFGLARLLQGEAITTYGLALGTPSFMSPEQAAGRIDEIDGRTDLFALAATGFRVRSSQRIHEGDNPVELVGKMAKIPAPHLGTVAPDVSAPFARVIDRALQFRREDRYESAAAMREDIRLAIDELEKDAPPMRIAVSAPPLPRPPRGSPVARHEATMDVSDGDLETLRSADEESIRIPRNRSPLPWIALVVLAGFGVKLGFDRGTWHRWVEQLSPPPSVSVASASAEAVDASHDAFVSDAALAPKPPAASAPASSTHRSPPPKPGPGKVHKGPGKPLTPLHQ
jgi:serine/threonine protein kinase